MSTGRRKPRALRFHLRTHSDRRSPPAPFARFPVHRPSLRTVLQLVVLGLLCGAPRAGAARTWFKFNSAFITAHYPQGVAFGSVSASTWHPASQTHSSSCGGSDGELHVGTRETQLTLGAGESPLSGPETGADAAWGIVAELPNAAAGNGPSTLHSMGTSPVTFDGYFRVWNEGHAQGASPPSNPHHVFEVHPAWGFTSGTTHFEERSLVRSISAYHGYGASKFKPALLAIKAGQWPLAYQSGGFLHVALDKRENFFQLPVKVKTLQTITGGHEVTVDVFSDKACTHLVYSDLRCITVDGSPIDDAAVSTFAQGKKLFLLGFFSANLARAADASGNAHSETEAVAVPEALEFLIFGKATKSAVASCSSH